MNTKRIFASVLSSVIAMGAFAGCSSGTGDSSTGSTGNSASASAGTPEPVTLKGWGAFAFVDSTGNKNYSDQIAWKEIEKKTGIKVDWTVVTTANNNAPTQFGLMMAAQDLPDFFVDVNPMLLEEFGRKGAIMPLNDLIGSKIPELDKLLKDDPGARGSITSSDGKIYFFPRLLNDIGTRCWPGYMVRQDWLDQVGMKAPESTEDFYNVLKAFKEKIPTASKPYTGDPKPLVWAFGVGSRGTGNSNDDTFLENGEIKFGPTDPRYKDALMYINKLYSEGLLDPEWNGISGDQITTNVMTELSGSTFGSFSGYLGRYNGLFAKDGKGEPFVAVAPLVGPTGTRGTQGMHTSIDLGWAGGVASTTKKADDVARLFNHTYGEGLLDFYFGIEGDTYTIIDGAPTYTEKVTTHELGTLGYGNNFISNISCFPSNYLLSVYHSILTEEGKRGNKITTDNAGTLKVPAIRFSEAEIANVNAIMRDVNAYADENFAAFVNGQKQFSEWDAYIAGYEKLRLNELLTIYNDAYKRFIEASK